MISAHQNLGLNQDLSPVSQEYHKFYWEAWNMQVIFDKDSNSFLISNEGGNDKVFTLPNDIVVDTVTARDNGATTRIRIGVDGTYNQTLYTTRDESDFDGINISNIRIIGWGIAEKALYFMTAQTISFSEDNIGHIWKWEYQPNYSENDLPTLVYAGKLGWERDRMLNVEMNYENEEVIKIYINSGTTSIKSINVANDTDTTGEIGSEHPIDYTVNAIDISPKVWLPQISADTLSGGSFSAGVIQWTYCLYNKNGNQTKIATPSNLVTVTKDGRGLSSTEIGDVAFRLNLSGLDTSFDYIRVFRMFYNINNALTVTEIFNGNHDGDLSIVDNNSLFVDSISFNDLVSIGTDYFTSQAMTKMNNKLFVGNIEEEEIDLSDYDTRAYRFDNTGQAIIQDLDGNTEHTITSAGIAAGLSNANSWPNALNNPEWDTLDAINPSNLVHLDETNGNWKKYKYKSDGTTIGAEGPNIDIEFPDFVDLEYYRGYGGSDYRFREYKTNEIYRIGIRFITERNNSSFVKWICDLRIPSFQERTLITGQSLHASDSVGVLNLPIKVTVKNQSDLPDNIVGYQIMRLERGVEDLTILDTVVLNSTMSNGPSNFQPGNYQMVLTPNPCLRTGGTGVGTIEHLFDMSGNGEINTTGANYRNRSDVVNVYSPKHIVNGDTIVLDSSEKVRFSAGGNDNSKTWYKRNGGSTNWTNDNHWISSWNPGGSVIGRNLLNTTNVGSGPGAKPELTAPGGPQGHDGSSKIYISQSNNLTCPSTSLEIFEEFDELFSVGKGTSSYEIEDADFSTYRNYLFTVGSYSSPASGNVIISTFHTKCFVMEFTTGTLDSKIDDTLGASPVVADGSFVIADMHRENLGQYSGYGYGSRASNQYIPASDVVKLDPLGLDQTIFVRNGDTFISKFNFVKNSTEINESSGITSSDFDLTLEMAENAPSGTVYTVLGEYCSIWLESSLNLDLRSDEMYQDNFKNREFDEDLLNDYQYSEIYNKQDNQITYPSQPLTTNIVTRFKNTVKYSDTKVENETYDSFLQFRVGNFGTVPNEFGGITNLIEHNNVLLVSQAYGIGYWIVSPLAITSASGAGPTALGTGSTLQKYIILDTRNGTTYRNGFVKGQRGTYFFDGHTKRFCKVNQDAQPALSDVKGLYNYLNEKYPFFDDTQWKVYMGYDPKTFTVYCTILEEEPEFAAEYGSITFSYNEMTDSFISFHNFTPTVYMNDRERFYSHAGYGNNDSVWLHNKLLRTSFYGTNYDFSVEYIVNGDGQTNNQYHNVEYKLSIKDSNMNYYPDINFTDMRVSNETQTTEDVLLNNGRVATRSQDKWRIFIKRDQNSRRDRGRMGGHWVKVRLRYSDVSNYDYKFRLYPVMVNYERLIL